MWVCSALSRQLPLRCTISQTQGAYLHGFRFFFPFFCIDETRTSSVSSRGPWTRPRNAWRLEARQPTTFPNLRVAQKTHPYQYQLTHSPTSLKYNLDRTFVPLAVIQLARSKTRQRNSMRVCESTMIHKAKTHVDDWSVSILL